MNRKQKIIVSVTGIFLVALILIGLTYAYFLTQITGNTKDKSISVTTADLRVVYGDGTKELLTSSTKLVPSSNAINTKDFTVTNNGDDTHYVVIIENVRVKNAKTGYGTTFDSNDFKYTLTCTKSDGSSCNGVSTQTTLPMSDSILVTNEIDSDDTHTYVMTLWYLDNGKDQSSDMNKTLEARINIEDPNRINPYTDKPNSLAYNIINNALNVTQENEDKGYALYRSIPLTEPSKEKSAYYIGKTYESTFIERNSKSKDNCGDEIQYSDEYTVNENGKFSLVNPQKTNIINLKDMIDDDKVIYSSMGLCYDNITNTDHIYKITNMSVSENGYFYDYYLQAIVHGSENTLSVSPDDYTKTTGNNSYYFRGEVKNNYLEYNNMCWRIVRIEGDGSVKLTLAKEDLCSTITGEDYFTATIGDANYGHTADNFPDYENSVNTTTSIKYKLNEWLNGYLEDGKTKRFSTNEINKIKETKICIENHFSRNYSRGEVYFTCSTNALSAGKYQVYPLTADEEIFAGATPYSYGNLTYLRENANNGYHLLSVYEEDGGAVGAFQLYSDSELTFDLISSGSWETKYGIRPAISLIPGIELASDSGNGTQTNPYKVKVD